MAFVIIDSTNYMRLKVRRGDEVLDKQGNPLGEVRRLNRDGHIIWRSYGNCSVDVRCHFGPWDVYFEKLGLRLRRKVAPAMEGGTA